MKTRNWFIGGCMFVAIVLAVFAALLSMDVEPSQAMRMDEVRASRNLAPDAAITYGSGAYHTGSYAPNTVVHETFNPAAAPTLGTFNNGTTTGTAYKKTATWTQPGEVRNVKITAAKFKQITGIKPVTVNGRTLDGTRVSESVSFGKNGVGHSRNCYRSISSVVSSTANNAFGTATSAFTVAGGKRIGLAMKPLVMHKHSFNGAGSATPPTPDTTYNCYSTPSALDGSKREEVWYKAPIYPYQ